MNPCVSSGTRFSAAESLVVCIREIVLGLSEAKCLAEVIRSELGWGEEKGNPSTF